MGSFGPFIVLTALAPLAACAAQATTTGDSGTVGMCTSLANSAPAITPTTGDASVPTGTGGTVAAGTYFLTSVVRTPTSILPEMKFRQTLTISGSSIESVSQDGDQPPNNEVLTFATSSSSIVFTIMCSTRAAASAARYDSYTADASRLILYDVATLGITVTYTRQD